MPPWGAPPPLQHLCPPDLPPALGTDFWPQTLSSHHAPWALFHLQTPHPEQLGPTVGSAEGLDLVSTKDLAGQLTDHDWSLFNSIHQVLRRSGGEEWAMGTPRPLC